MSPKQICRQDWICEALTALSTNGPEGIKVALLAQKLGVTTGSFYWHFNNLSELRSATIQCWEREFTDVIIEDVRRFKGSSKQRIFYLMNYVATTNATQSDRAISIWCNSNEYAQTVFTRALLKRFEFATDMFLEAKFNKSKAQIRGGMLVSSLMGITALNFKPAAKTKFLKDLHDFLLE